MTMTWSFSRLRAENLFVRDYQFSFHIIVTISAKDIAREWKNSRLRRSDADLSRFARFSSSVNIHVWHIKTVRLVQRRNLQNYSHAFF